MQIIIKKQKHFNLTRSYHKNSLDCIKCKVFKITPNLSSICIQMQARSDSPLYTVWSWQCRSYTENLFAIEDRALESNLVQIRKQYFMIESMTKVERTQYYANPFYINNTIYYIGENKVEKNYWLEFSFSRHTLVTFVRPIAFSPLRVFMWIRRLSKNIGWT